MKTPIHVTNFLQPPTTELSHFLAGDNQLVVCNGVNPCFKKGVLYKDTGYSIIGSAIGATKITGLHDFHQSYAVRKLLATTNNAAGTALELYYSTGGAWTEITDAETAWTGYEDAKVEMEDFLGHCFFVGYDSTDNVFLPVASLTGTTFSTSANVTSMPQGKYIKRYRDRLYVANAYSGAAYPYRVYFSSVPSAGAITWTPATDFIDVDFSEGITGIEQNWDRLMVFTEQSAYMYDQTSKKKVWDVGCINGSTLKNLGGYMIWASMDNVWASTSGRPTPIGSDIQELIRQSVDKTKWRAAVVDNEYHLYLGNTEANGIVYMNCLATFNADLGMWRWRELFNVTSELCSYVTDSTTYLGIGTALGSVMKKSKPTDSSPVYSDNTKPIVAHFRTKAYDLGDPSILKEITKLFVYAEYAQGLTMAYRIFDKNQEQIQEFQNIGTLSKVINQFNKDMKGYFIQFEGREISTRQSFRFYGFTMLATSGTTAI